jgi:uncharacterized protein YdaU (DUF1376 family)
MKPPYVRLYVKDFAFEIQGMTKKQIGEYMLKFLESYRQESIPDEFSKHSLFSELQNSFQNYAETCEKNRKNIKKRYSKKNIDNASESNTCTYQSYENGKPVEYLTNNQEPITNNQEPEVKKKNIKKKKDEVEKPEDVSEEAWQGWVALRKKKQATVTELVISTLRKEADLLGWTLEQAMSESCLRNWQGFKASWVRNEMARGDVFQPARPHQNTVGMGGSLNKEEIVLRLKNGAWNDAGVLGDLLHQLETLRLVATQLHEKNDLQRLINKSNLRLSELTGESPF